MRGTLRIIDERKANSLFMVEYSMKEFSFGARFGLCLHQWAMETIQSFGRTASPLLADRGSLYPSGRL